MSWSLLGSSIKQYKGVIDLNTNGPTFSRRRPLLSHRVWSTKRVFERGASTILDQRSYISLGKGGQNGSQQIPALKKGCSSLMEKQPFTLGSLSGVSSPPERVARFSRNRSSFRSKRRRCSSPASSGRASSCGFHDRYRTSCSRRTVREPGVRCRC